MRQGNQTVLLQQNAILVRSLRKPIARRQHVRHDRLFQQELYGVEEVIEHSDLGIRVFGDELDGHIGSEADGVLNV